MCGRRDKIIRRSCIKYSDWPWFDNKTENEKIPSNYSHNSIHELAMEQNGAETGANATGTSRFTAISCFATSHHRQKSGTQQKGEQASVVIIKIRTTVMTLWGGTIMSAPWIVQFKMRQRFTLTLIRCASGILYTRKMYLSRWCSMMRVISCEAVAMRIIRSSNKLMLRESSAISFRFVSFCVDGRLFSIILIVFLFSLCSVCCTKYLFRSFFYGLFIYGQKRNYYQKMFLSFAYILYFIFMFSFSIQKFSL